MTSSSGQQQYHLDLEPQKRNVFVTQLHDREDEEDVTAFPVVTESGDKLIETGINTLQKTLLLKKEVEVERVDQELAAKRHEFKARMEACAQRQVEVQKKQQKMKDRVAKFEKFIAENEAKRRRAIQKYQQEVKLRDQKTDEFSLLLQQLEELKQRHVYLENKMARYKKFEEYLLRVIDALPEDYLPSSEDKVKGLMMRHRTLSESNKGLVDNLVSMGDQLEELKVRLGDMKGDHNKHKVSINSQLAVLQTQHEVMTQDNKRSEEWFQANKGDMRSRRTDMGIILMAIENIYEKCRKTLDPPPESLSLEEKLDKTKDYLKDRDDVAHKALAMIQREQSTSDNLSPEPLKRSAKTRRHLRVNVVSPTHH